MLISMHKFVCVELFFVIGVGNVRASLYGFNMPTSLQSKSTSPQNSGQVISAHEQGFFAHEVIFFNCVLARVRVGVRCVLFFTKKRGAALLLPPLLIRSINVSFSVEP